MKNSIKSIVKRSPFEIATLGAILALSLFVFLPSAARATAGALDVSRATAVKT